MSEPSAPAAAPAPASAASPASAAPPAASGPAEAPAPASPASPSPPLALTTWRLVHRLMWVRMLLLLGLGGLAVVGFPLALLLGFLAAMLLADVNEALGILGGLVTAAVGLVGLVLALGRLGGLLGRVTVRAGEAVVGDDGLLVIGRVRARFLSWTDVESVEVEGLDEVIVRAEDRGGGVIAPPRTLRLLAATAHGLCDAARAALERHRARPPARSIEALELGAHESLGVWADRARALAAGGCYREEAVTLEELVALAEDPHARSAQRLGAALALAGAPAPARARVRAAAARVAEPGLGRALEGCLEGLVPEPRAHASRSRRAPAARAAPLPR